MDKENDIDNKIEDFLVRRHAGAIGLFLFGLVLPFISNTIGGLYSGVYPRYLCVLNEGGLVFLIFLEIFNLVPVILCLLSFYCHVLKMLRFLPVITTYLFIFWGHTDIPPDYGAVWTLLILVVPLFSIPVFIVSFIIALIIGYFVANKFHDELL
ncbi:MAG: hypothetical protein LBK82_08645 [Planctomycetaceae bacterium]|jgi:hypothetical protein|nr:hypothetical protein [Planctomycetaceae bacterium]